MYKLISATPSPYARKVRIQLAEKEIPFELITEVPWHSETQTPRWNPLEKLPVLICPNGESVFESRYINEWVEMPKKKYPDRSGLKGGWWGPVRGRCRPTVTFHKEDDYGYEEGFRCCKDAGG